MNYMYILVISSIILGLSIFYYNKNRVFSIIKYDYDNIYGTNSDIFLRNNKDFIQTEYQTKLLEPVDYYKNMTGKNIRKQLTTYLGTMLHIDPKLVDVINYMINDFHNASLVIDDIQDESLLRRNEKAAHIVYGIPMSFGAANLLIFKNIFEYNKKIEPYINYSHLKQRPEFKDLDNNIIRQIVSNQSLTKMVECMYLTNLGQQMDVYWAKNKIVPTMPEYEYMIKNKTGNLFMCVLDIFRGISANITDADYEYYKNKINNLSTFFQIRDDYVNITDPVFWKQKGFCEDFDEKKYSFVIITFLNSSSITPNTKTEFMKLFNRKHLSDINKCKMLHILNKTGVLDEVYMKLEELMSDIQVIKISYDKLTFHKFDVKILQDIEMKHVENRTDQRDRRKLGNDILFNSL